MNLVRKIKVLAVLLGFAVDITLSIGGGLILGVVFGVTHVMSGSSLEGLEQAYYGSMGMMTGGVLIGACATVFGGIATAFYAREAPVYNALLLGLMGFVSGLFFLEMQPLWVSIVGFSLIFPAAALGGWIGSRLFPPREEIVFPDDPEDFEETA